MRNIGVEVDSSLVSNQVLFIIGASGLLGKALSNQFSHPDWKVVVSYSRLEGDLTAIKNELSTLGLANPTSRITVINCAWSPRPTGANRLNPSNQIWIQITKKLLEFCVQMNFSFYGVGTCLEKEFTIQDSYTTAKRECAKIILAARSEASDKDKHVVLGWFRPYYIYSLNPPTPALVRFAADQINYRDSNQSLGRFIQIDTDNSHDYIELEVCVNLIEKIITSKRSGIFDLGTGQTESNVSLLTRLFPGISISVAENKNSIAGTSKAADMGWEEKV